MRERRVYLTMTIYLLLKYSAEIWAWTKAHIGRMVVAGMKILNVQNEKVVENQKSKYHRI
jgi:hypothetical protein